MNKDNNVCNDRGQALVEFALVLPILLLVVFGVVQFAFIMGGQILVSSAAREGVRLAAVGEPDSIIKDKVLDVTSPIPIIDVDSDKIDISPSQMANRKEGVTISLKVPGEVMVIVPFFTNTSYPVNAKATMRFELTDRYREKEGDQVNIFGLVAERKKQKNRFYGNIYFNIANNYGYPVPDSSANLEIQRSEADGGEANWETWIGPEDLSSNEYGTIHWEPQLCQVEDVNDKDLFKLIIHDVTADGLVWEEEIIQVLENI